MDRGRVACVRVSARRARARRTVAGDRDDGARRSRRVPAPGPASAFKFTSESVVAGNATRHGERVSSRGESETLALSPALGLIKKLDRRLLPSHRQVQSQRPPATADPRRKCSPPLRRDRDVGRRLPVTDLRPGHGHLRTW